MTKREAIAAILHDAGFTTDQIVNTDDGHRTAFEVLEGAVEGALDEIEEGTQDEDDPAEPEPDDSMDGDHRSALESAGWGTDEDYGGDIERL